MNPDDFKSGDPIAWCPGCGDFGILNAVKSALAALGREPRDVLLVSGIGQAAKMPHYVKANCFNGLHGRALPAAAAAKIVNSGLTVIVATGDGDCYGEGGNHFIHNIRRNVDITVIVCNNQIYGLTKGQASPTTDLGYETKVQVEGVILDPIHPLEMAVALGCGFVARGYSADSGGLAGLISEGIKYKGFSLIDVLQPCVSFNKKNTYSWYKERIYDISGEKGYDPQDKMSAYRKAAEWGERIPVGIIYRAARQSYGERAGLDGKAALIDADIGEIDLTAALKDFE
ncbi:MAG: 2-oxoacid:ferredoxin oxidoreductase subunit beta [Candidatus Omnitrophica bacterium]|jgi:2-oxoglutarate ferredoxin oxidoreductase subunit beta|nr:2-oxoacid:ferredoxin oxidoreductase subunit beta [Candidatus Omnitrophota bacterium]